MLTLKQVLEVYVKYRKEIVRKRCEFELKKAEERKEIVEGLLIALKNINGVVKIIKESKHVSDALEKLVKKFKLSQKQAEAILEMRLARLTALEQKKLKDELASLKKIIAELKKILSSEKEILNVVKKELLEVRRRYGDERRTRILERVPNVKEKDLVEKEQVAVTLTAKGYIKRLPLKTYKEQKRGGKGVAGTGLSTGDFVKSLVACSTHDYLLFFTTKGRLQVMQAYELPSGSRYSKGKAAVNLLKLNKGEGIAEIIPVQNFEGALMLITRKGMVKKISLGHFVKVRSGGVIAVNLPEDDEVVDVKLLSDSEEVFIATALGQAIKFSSKDVRAMGRNAYGVIGIKLKRDDFVVGAEVFPEGEKELAVLTITEQGFGKRTVLGQYRKTARAGKGIVNIKVGEKTGKAKGVVLVNAEDSIIVMTSKGMVIRTAVKDIRLAGRATRGVHVIKLGEGDSVSSLSKVVEE